MKTFSFERLAVIAGVGLMGYSAGLVSSHPGQAQPGAYSVTGSQAAGTQPAPVAEAPRRSFHCGGPGMPPGGPPRDGKSHGPMLGHLLDELDLTDDQRAAISKVLGQERSQMEGLHDQIQQIQAQTRSKVESLLSSEQVQELAESEKEVFAHGPGHGRGPGPREEQCGDEETESSKPETGTGSYPAQSKRAASAK